MALRCPECRGHGTLYFFKEEPFRGRFWNAEQWLPESTRVLVPFECPACHGTGWRIPPSLPKKVAERISKRVLPDTPDKSDTVVILQQNS